MYDLISRQAAIDAVADLYWMDERLLNFKKEIDVTFGKIKALPSADPVKRGRWIKDDVGVHCSECFCGWDFLTGVPVEVYGFHYCPNCGARMDGEE